MNRVLRTHARLLGGVLTIALAAIPALSSQIQPASRWNTDRSGLMARGYDVVAYFTEGRPVRGTAEFEHAWDGARWRFATAANRDAFAAAPQKYAPQYGGFCAYAVSRNYTADGDPQAWTIVDGRLFLNYSLSVRATWLKDRDANIAKGDANWPALSRK